MRRRPILAGPRQGWAGLLLEMACGLPVVGNAFARAQRVRRKRLRTSLQGSAGPPPELLGCADVRACAEALRKWPQLPQLPTRLEPMQGSATDPSIRCSVIINTINRARELERTLADLKRQWQEDRDELILVLGPTYDDSREVIAAAGIPCRLIDCPQPNLAQSRNLGLAAARGESVAFLDDDASPCPGWLDHLLAPLAADPACGVSAGFAMDGTGTRFLTRYVASDRLGNSTWWTTAEEAHQHLQQDTGCFLTATGCSMALRRDAALALGGFDPFYAYFLEETDLVLRLRQAGFACVAAADSLVLHRQGENLVRTAPAAGSTRLRMLKSQLHFIRKFAAGIPMEAISRSVWRRILLDLERIAWECPADAAVVQTAYLQGVRDELAMHLRSE